MVRVAVFSDTHGEFTNLESVLPQFGPVDWLLHAGDHFGDAAQVGRRLGLGPERIVAVVGNCDAPQTEPAQVVLEIGGVKILLTHGHHYGVKSTLDRILYRAAELEVRVAVFGHSHIPVNGQDGGVLLFNPGSLTAPRLPQDPPSCGILEIAGGQVTARHLFASQKPA
ncbi:MAG: putative phosphoesterase [Firmicutes bacterium]|nr:putative phosphoesterase [Bacillota bacterium]